MGHAVDRIPRSLALGNPLSPGSGEPFAWDILLGFRFLFRRAHETNKAILRIWVSEVKRLASPEFIDKLFDLTGFCPCEKFAD